MQWIAFVWISENCTQTKQIFSQNSAMALNDSGGRDIASSSLANKIRLTEQTKTIFTQRKHWLFASRAARCYRWMPSSSVCCCVLTSVVCTIENVKIKHLSTLHWDSVDALCVLIWVCNRQFPNPHFFPLMNCRFLEWKPSSDTPNGNQKSNHLSIAKRQTVRASSGIFQGNMPNRSNLGFASIYRWHQQGKFQLMKWNAI